MSEPSHPRAVSALESVNWIFFNESGILRSGWRSFFFASLFSVTIVFLFSVAIGFGIDVRGGTKAGVAINALMILMPALGIGLFCTRMFEKLGVSELGIAISGRSLRNFALGIVAGALTLAGAVVIAIAAGGLSFRSNSMDFKSLAISFLVFAVAAAWEEAVFRGYVLQTLSRAGYAWLAIAVTATFFGLGHAGNPNATAISTLNTVLAGIWFGVAYLRTRDLWFVWAMHFIWNWAQGSVLGIEVSGMITMSGSTMLSEVDRGPDWLTGTTYGIEGGIAATIALAISTAAIHFRRSKKERAALGGLDLETDVDGASRMSQFPNRDQIHPGVSE